jgi:predicted ATPase/class 3 adenylate cyclase
MPITVPADHHELRPDADTPPERSPDTPRRSTAPVGEGSSRYPDRALPSGIVTFLFTDVEGSTRLWERLPDEAGRALTRHDQLIETIVAQHAGVLIRPRGEGDSRFAVFDHATDAVIAAVAIQQALAAEPWPTPTPLRVRMALHTGEADLREGDYYGAAVNRCARLRGLAHGGQTLLSMVTAKLAHDDLPNGVGLRDMGEHRLKDLSRPEQVYQLLAPGLADEFPPLASLNERGTNLPIQPTALIGRDDAVRAACAFLRSETRLLTLSGPAGVGKTRLALQVAAELLDDFADGVYQVELASVSEMERVAPAIVEALNLAEEREQPLLTTLRDHLRDRQLLLLLDNFEQVIGAASLVADLLLAAPRLRILVTSRAVLRVYGEQEFQVPPLELPDLRRFPPVGARLVVPALVQPELVPDLALSPAIALFTQRAREVRPDFTLTETNARAVAEVCQKLDGLPLAIELAAARCRVLSPASLLARLNDRLALLAGGARERTPRQQTLRDAIGWSYDLLDPAEQALFARHAVFVGGATIEAVETVVSELRIENEELRKDPETEQFSILNSQFSILDGLASLVDKSLLRQVEVDDGASRFTMLETIREYALERLILRDEAEPLRQRHAQYYLRLAELAEPQLTGADQAAWLKQIERDHDNLRAALGWALERASPALALRFGAALWRFWYLRGYLSEGRVWLERVLVAATHTTSPLTRLRAQVCNAAGVLAREQGDYARALALHEQSLVSFRDLGDRQGVADALNNLGTVASEQGDYVRAQALLAEALALCRNLDDQRGEALALNNLGTIAGEQGDYALSKILFAEALALRRDLDDKQGIADTLVNMGTIALLQDDYDGAARLSEECLALGRELGNKHLIVDTLVNLGAIALIQGDPDHAAELFAEGLALCRELGDVRNSAYCLEGLAGVAGAQGRPERAARLWGTAEALRETRGVPLPPAERARYHERVAVTRAQLDEHIWVAAWQAGRAAAWQVGHALPTGDRRGA